MKSPFFSAKWQEKIVKSFRSSLLFFMNFGFAVQAKGPGVRSLVWHRKDKYGFLCLLYWYCGGVRDDRIRKTMAVGVGLAHCHLLRVVGRRRAAGSVRDAVYRDSDRGHLMSSSICKVPTPSQCPMHIHTQTQVTLTPVKTEKNNQREWHCRITLTSRNPVFLPSGRKNV